MGGVEKRPSNEVLPKSSVGNGLPESVRCVCVVWVCVFGKGVVSTRLTGLDETSSDEA